MRQITAWAFATDARLRWTVFLLIGFPVLLHWPLWSGWLKGDAMIWYSGVASGVSGAPIIGQPTLDNNIAFTSQALGMRAAQDWLSGHIPWWNPFEATGVPLAGEMQSAALFLPWILLLALPGGQLWFHILLEITAGFGTYLLLRRLQLGRLAAVTGGMLFEINGTYSWLANAVVNPVAFLPWLLLGIEILYQASRDGGHRDRAVGGVIVAVALAESLYAGFPETAYLNGLLALAWAVLRFAQLRGARWRYVLSLALTGVIGLLLAVPVVLPFFNYLQHAFVAGHAGGYDNFYIPIWGRAALPLPYIFGLPAASGLYVEKMPSFLHGAGGYLGVAMLVAASVGLWGRRERGLKVLLGLWTVAVLLKTYGQPQFMWLINHVPMVKDAVFARYIWPSIEIAVVVLAAFGIEAASEHRRPWLFVVTAVFAALGLIWLIAPSADVVAQILRAHLHFAVWLFGSLLVMVAVLMVWALGALWSPKRRAWLYAFVLVAEAGLYFFLPMLANPRHGQLELGGVHYLQAHLGLQRFYTLGPIQPNYGSAWRIAQINYNDLPIASSVVNFVHKRLDPYANTVIFNGNFPRASAFPVQAVMLRKNLHAYEAAGVAYVVAPTGINPFQRNVVGKTQNHGNEPFALSSGQSMSFTVHSVSAGNINAVAVVIGTYGGKADGKLRLRVCVSGACVEGGRSLKEAQDNHMFRVSLAHPLVVSNGDKLDVKLTHVSGTHPVAVWLWPLSGQSQQVLTAPRKQGFGVRYAFAYQVIRESEMPQRVYSDAVMDIYRLPHPVPYFKAEGCRLQPEGRERVTAVCDQASTLVRLETDLPGWRASVNGRSVGISRVDDLFQSVALPAGRSTVRFVYRPVHFGLIAGCFWGGLLALFAWVYWGIRRRAVVAGA